MLRPKHFYCWLRPAVGLLCLLTHHAMAAEALVNIQPHQDGVQPQLPIRQSVLGTVSDQHGNRVAGARVQVQLLHQPPVSVTTKEDGRFILQYRSRNLNESPLIVTGPDSDNMSYHRSQTPGLKQLVRVILKPARKILIRTTDSNGCRMASTADIHFRCFTTRTSQTNLDTYC